MNNLYLYREMSDDFIKGRWEDAETTELFSKILSWLHHHTSGAMSTLVDFIQLVEEMKILVPSSLLSKRMGRRSRLSCFRMWQKLVSESEFRGRQYYHRNSNSSISSSKH
jgi:hypothetical protein